MLIDWFTVVAQIVNFAILVLALKFLLYDRVTGVMEKRRLREHELREADTPSGKGRRRCEPRLPKRSWRR